MRIAFMRNTEKNLPFPYNCEYFKCSCTNEKNNKVYLAILLLA